MLNFIERKFPQFLFCTLGKFRAVEAIYETVLRGDITVPQFKRRNRKEFQIYQLTPRTLLSDRIRQKLKELQESSDITTDELREFTEMFDPKQGINLTMFQKLGQDERFFLGQNITKKFPFKLNSSMANNILSLIYQPIYQNNIFSRIGLSLKESNVIHVVGTPGFGKSSTIFATKYLNDIRIRHIIKNSCPEDSKISDNFKIFYFYSKISENKLKQIILSEVSKDFGNSQQLSSQMELEIFLQKLQRVYQNKNVKILVFVDQVNALYNESVKERGSYIEIWKKVHKHLLGLYPIFLVSSKNNPYIQKQNDPVIYIATSTGNQYLKKINLDNLMSPQARICYTAQCMLFELEKYMVKSKAIEFIKQLKQVPFLTHLAIRDIFKSLVSETQPQNYIKLIEEGNFEQVNKIIYKKIEENEDRAKLTKNSNESKSYKTRNQSQEGNAQGSQIQLANKNQSNQNDGLSEKNKNFSHSQIFGLLMAFFSETPSYKYIVKAVLKIKDEKNTQHTNHISFTSVFRTLQGKKTSQIIETTAMLNYFFIGFGLKDNKYSKTSEQGIIFNFDQKIYQNVKNSIYLEISPKLLRSLKLKHPKLFQVLNEYHKGMIFENSVCSVIQQNLKKIHPVIFLIQGQSQLDKVKYYSDQLSMNEQLYSSLVEILPNYIEFILILQQSQQQKVEKICYVRMQEKSDSFDFILSKTDNKKVKFFFVDTTVGVDVNKKIADFFTDMPENKNFRYFMEEISQKVESVEICYYVLRPNKEYFTNKIVKPIKTFSPDLQKFKQIATKIKNVEYKVGHLHQDFRIFRIQNFQYQYLAKQIVRVLYEIDK